MSSENARKRKSDSIAAASSSDVSGHGGGTEDEMDGRIMSRIDDLENKCESMQSEIDLQRQQSASLQNELDVTKSKCITLDAKCGSLERTLQLVILKSKKWEYSAPPIPSSHWTDLGFSDEYAEAMANFLEGLKEVTCQLRSGMSCNITLDGHEDLDLLHDDMLLHHWEEFADALQLCNHPEISSVTAFSISNVQLPSLVLDMLAPALQGKRFINFELCKNNFTNILDGIQFSVDFIRNNPDLSWFKWVDNPIGSVENIDYLVEAANSMPSLSRVYLENCCGENINGYNILCSLLRGNTSLLAIDLDSNNIRTNGGTHLSDFLATNPPLKCLYLENNHLNDSDTILIANSLKHNTRLEDIYLGNNEITDVGRIALSNAIFNLGSLNSAADSNHVCTIHNISLDERTNNHAYENGMICLHRNRARKIFSLLSSRNEKGSNVYHLNLELGDDSLKLVPAVLERLDLCARDHLHARNHHRALSIFYEVLRSWKMPSLYETHSFFIVRSKFTV